MLIKSHQSKNEATWDDVLMIDGVRIHHRSELFWIIPLAQLLSYVRPYDPPCIWRVETPHHGLMAFLRTCWTLLLQRTVVDEDGEAGEYRGTKRRQR